MTSHAASSLFGAIVARTIGERESVPLREVLAADIPDGVRAYVRAGLLRALGADLDAAPHLGPLVRGGGSAGRILRHTLHVVLPDMVLRRSQFLALLVDAVRFHESFVVRPRAALTAYLFPGGANAVPVENLLERLDAVGEYAYLAQLLRRYLAGSGAASVGPEEFRAIVDRLDDAVVQRHAPAELARLAGPVFTLHAQGTAAERRSPLTPLLAFYEDKRMDFLARYVERICSIRGIDALSLPELTEIIEDLYRTEPGAPHAEEAATGVPEHSAGGTAPVPGRQEPPPVPAAEESAAAVPPREEPPPPVPEPPVIVESRAAGAPAGSPPAPLPGLETLIDDDLRREFVRKLFHRDEAYYETIVRALNRLRNWDEATVYLRDLFEINRLDPLSPVVAAFTDTVQQRFEPDSDQPGGKQHEVR